MCYNGFVFWSTALSVLPNVMCARRAVPKIPPKSPGPPQLPLHNSRLPLTHSESTLLQVLIPLHFNSPRINVYKKTRGGVPPSTPKVLQLVTSSRPMRPRHTRHPAFATHPSSLATILFGITFFADPHPLTPIESHSCKNTGGGVPLTSILRYLLRLAQQRPQSLSAHGLT